MTGETVTILRAGAPSSDRYGNTIPGGDVRLEIAGCVVEPRPEGDAAGEGRVGVVIGAVVYMPSGTDVRSTDRLEIRGKTHTIEGDPADWRSPWTDWRPGIVVVTRRVEG